MNEDEVMWRFADAAWLYVVEDAHRAGHALVTVSVGDLDKAVDDMASRGVIGGSIEAVGDAGRKASFVDADGNTLSFIQVTSSAN